MDGQQQAQQARWSEIAIAWPAAVVAILLLQVMLVFTHEPFVDEWQALQIALESPDPATLLQNLRYEGHPPLWYALLYASGSLFGPAHALAGACLPLALATQALILIRGPFPRWLRVAIALGEPILFEYGTISRSSTLGVLLVFLALSTWDKRRWFWLPLALLPLTDFLFGCIALALLAVRARERPLWWPGVALFALAGLLAAWTIIPPPDFVPVYRSAAGPLQGTALLMFQLSSVALPLQWNAVPLWGGVLPFGLYRIAWLPFVWLCWEQTRGRPTERAALGGLLLVLWVFYAFLYTLANRHVMLVGVLLIALQWRRSAAGETPATPFMLWTGVGAVCGLAAAATALTIPFDTGPIAARFIREHGLAQRQWVAAPAQHGQGIAAMTGLRFQGAGLQCTSDFVRWNFPHTVFDAKSLDAWIRRAADQRGRFYLLSEVALPQNRAATLIDHVPPGFDGKPYFIYSINAAAVDGRPLPPCVSGMRTLPPLRPDMG